MNDTTKEYVFLSYSHKDDIEPLLDWLDRKGYNAVYDSELSLGDLWDMKVRRYINNKKCKGVLSVLSRASLVSPAILKETDYVHLFNKSSACVLLDNCSLAETHALIVNEDDKEIAASIMERFPPEKIYITLNELLASPDNKLDSTLEQWGVHVETDPTEISLLPIDRYTSEIKGEAERLNRQQLGYFNFDMDAINKAIEESPKDEFVVLDLGCSNGEITSSRFEDDRFKVVIGVDYNASDIEKAKAADYGAKFHFYHMDLESDEFIAELNDKLKLLNIAKVDIVFMALTLHHLKDPHKFLFKLYDVFSDSGVIILRGSDDGGKLCYPESELLSEFLTRYDVLVSSVSDRCNGRKMYKQLSDAGYLDIKMMYQVVDTCEKTRAEKANFYRVGFGFREVRLQEIAERNPQNAGIQKEVEWQLKALFKIKELFGRRDFWYSNVSYIAMAAVG